MTLFERKIDLCLRYIASEDAVEREWLAMEAREILEAGETEYETAPAKIQQTVEDLLSEVGVPCSMLGHAYLVYALVMALDNPKLVLHGSITTKLYPAIAEKFDAKPANVERAIRQAATYVFDNCDVDVNAYLFGNSVSVHKGVATNNQFIAALAKELRRRI
jgi:hypothetical protein